MRQNRVKNVMKQGQLALGTYVTFADPQIIEIIGLAGFDAAFIDMEHTTFDLGMVSQMIAAADLAAAERHPVLGDSFAELLRKLPDDAAGVRVIDGLSL